MYRLGSRSRDMAVDGARFQDQGSRTVRRTVRYEGVHHVAALLHPKLVVPAPIGSVINFNTVGVVMLP